MYTSDRRTSAKALPVGCWKLGERLAKQDMGIDLFGSGDRGRDVRRAQMVYEAYGWKRR